MTTAITPMTMAPVEPDRAFEFLRTNPRDAKPRHAGLTEIRGPYYSVMGRRYLADVLETMGSYVDSLKFAGGSFTLLPRRSLKELIELCHSHDVTVSTGGFIERVLTQGFHNEGPTFAPNGRVLMFFRDVGQGPSLYTIDITGRNELKVPTPSYSSDPAWSPLLS